MEHEPKAHELHSNQEDLDVLHGEKSKLESEIASLEEAKATLEERMRDLKGEISRRERRIDEINLDIRNPGGPRFGDLKGKYASEDLKEVWTKYGYNAYVEECFHRGRMPYPESSGKFD